MRTPTHVKLLCIVATMAAVLAPALAAPARTIRVPRMLSTAATIDRARAELRVGRPLTHVAFSWTGTAGGRILYRTIDGRGHASPWRRAPESHDLAYNDRHFTGVLAVDGATSIRWRRIAPRRGWIGPVTVDLLDAVNGPRMTVRVPAVAHGLASEPRIVTRSEWGADESLRRSSGGCRRTFFPVQQMFVHHTAGSNRDVRPRATMRSIYWFHTQRRGWCDIAYNFLIARGGTVFEGRWARGYLPWETHDAEDPSDLLVRGAHTGDHNPGSVGIALLGNFVSRRPTRAARRSLIRVLSWEADRHDLGPRRRHIYVNGETGARDRLPFIAGHRDARSTTCPGGVLYRMLPGIRRAVARRIGPGKVGTAFELTRSPSTMTFGGTATVTATLTAAGSALGGASVQLFQRAHGHAWEPLGEGVTDGSGRISVEVAPSVRMTFAAVYEGDSARWGADSRTMKLPVAPAVTSSAPGGTPDSTGVVHFPPGTTTIAVQGTVTPAHPGGGVRIVIERLDDLGAVSSSETASVPLAVDGSSYAYTFGVLDGRYRIKVVLPGHADHARGSAPDLNVVVGDTP